MSVGCCAGWKAVLEGCQRGQGSCIKEEPWHGRCAADCLPSISFRGQDARMYINGQLLRCAKVGCLGLKHVVACISMYVYKVIAWERRCSAMCRPRRSCLRTMTRGRARRSCAAAPICRRGMRALGRRCDRFSAAMLPAIGTAGTPVARKAVGHTSAQKPCPE